MPVALVISVTSFAKQSRTLAKIVLVLFAYLLLLLHIYIYYYMYIYIYATLPIKARTFALSDLHSTDSS